MGGKGVVAWRGVGRGRVAGGWEGGGHVEANSLALFTLPQQKAAQAVQRVTSLLTGK